MNIARSNLVLVFCCYREGLPIVGGAGGKGTWGKLTEVYNEDGAVRDNKDPNYSSEDDVRCAYEGH